MKTLVTLGLLFAVCSACSADDPPSDTGGPPVEASATFGDAGGKLDARCGSLEIPIGAFDRTTKVTLRSVPGEVKGPLEARGEFCLLDVGGAEIKTALGLSFPYDGKGFTPGVLPPPTLVVVGQFDGTGEWTGVDMPTLPFAGRIFASVRSGGVYGPVLALANSSICAANISFCAAITSTAGPTPPPTWTGIPGTTTGPYEMGVLYKYFKDPGHWTEGACMLMVACTQEPLSAETQLAIQTKCKRLPCPYDMLCAAALVREELEKSPKNVCRNYAWAMREALSYLGYSASFECGWDGVVGHAWVEVACGGKRYLLDAFADTYISMDGPVAPYCGNKVQEGTEQCDGDATVCSKPSECSATCQCVPLCGNGRLDPSEQCDPSGCPSGQECRDCQCVKPPVCGNAILEPGEECDTGFTCAGGKTCASCKCVAPVCGNGTVETGEDCETSAQCDSSHECKSCKCVSRCGNSVLDPLEDCDTGFACGAGSECVSCKCKPLCGNLKVDPAEECDGVGVATCTGVGRECYKCKCQKFVACAGISDKSTCTGCCEGAATSGAEFTECMTINCPP